MAELLPTPSPSSSRPARPSPPRGPSALLRIGVVTLTLGMFGCDHVTKVAAEAALANRPPVSLVRGLLELRYTQNSDAAFSLLSRLGVERSPALLLTLAGAALVAIVVAWIAMCRRASAAAHVGFALIVSGALGNVVDRAARGYVVDFIHLTSWPVFNVADVAVVAGMILLVLARPLRAMAA